MCCKKICCFAVVVSVHMGAKVFVWSHYNSYPVRPPSQPTLDFIPLLSTYRTEFSEKNGLQKWVKKKENTEYNRAITVDTFTITQDSFCHF